MTEPLPCPFCGNKEIEVTRPFSWFAVQCTFLREDGWECGVIGPWSATGEGAIKEWNTRAQVQQTS